MAEEKRPRGRPTTFREEYCELIIEMGRQGRLPYQWAREIGVSMSTMATWKGNNENFKHAWEIAMTNHIAHLADALDEDAIRNYKYVDFALKRFHHISDEKPPETDPTKGININVNFNKDKDADVEVKED